MAPVKFGLFKSRSRDQPEQPSTENLLKTSHSSDYVAAPESPVPSTSRGHLDLSPADMSILSLDSDDEISSIHQRSRRDSESSDLQENQVEYVNLQTPSTCTATSATNNQNQEDEDTLGLEDDASTSCDANSLQFDETSIAASEDMSMYCSMLKKNKKGRKVQRLKDLDMWHASNVEVMQNLLSRSGTLDEQIKWEAIATARGLCTLTDSCTCDDCTGAKYLAGVTDGDGGLGTAPLFNAINVGCQVQ